MLGRAAGRLPNSNLLRTMARIYAVSDLHVDVQQNLHWLASWSSSAFKNDMLIVAGDVTDNMSLLKSTLRSLTERFAQVFYVPGNHELWINDKTTEEDSIKKFHAIISLCDSIGVNTRPMKVHCLHGQDVWVVPLFSWYSDPEKEAKETLYVSRESEDVELTQQAWMDNHRCRWPEKRNIPAKYFANLNEEFIKVYDSPVISFSHFVPRLDLISTTDTEMERVQAERQKLGLPSMDNPKAQGAFVKFNFTRYAGSKLIERQIRELGSKVHVYGHQHRNRDRVIDGVRYASYCRGYPREQAMGVVWGFPEDGGPKQIWP